MTLPTPDSGTDAWPPVPSWEYRSLQAWPETKDRPYRGDEDEMRSCHISMLTRQNCHRGHRWHKARHRQFARITTNVVCSAGHPLPDRTPPGGGVKFTITGTDSRKADSSCRRINCCFTTAKRGQRRNPQSQALITKKNATATGLYRSRIENIGSPTDN